MKKRLAVFDFDKTICGFSVDLAGEIETHDIIFADGQIPPDFKELKSWTERIRYKIKTLNARNLNKDQVMAIFKQLCERNRTLVEGMQQVIEYLHQDHDIILLSDNETLTPSVFLARFGLLKYFTHVFARKMEIDQNGQISFEDMPKTDCPLGGLFLCKGQVLMDYIKDKDYENVSYFGDGSNDFCPATRLTENDRVFPRKDLPLDLKIRENGDDVQAKVQSWENGIDLLVYLKE